MIFAPVIAITTGEPAGIGPEISLVAAVRIHALNRVAATTLRPRLILLGDRHLLAERARQAHLDVALIEYQPEAKSPGPAQTNTQQVIEVLHQPLGAACIAGQLNAANSAYVLGLIDTAIAGALTRKRKNDSSDLNAGFDAIVTAPVQKSVINDAGIAFTGHTEYLAEKTNTARVVMMLAGQVKNAASQSWLRVALATTHLALKDVPAALSAASLSETLNILDADLRQRFGIAVPRILVTGLNPHAGEGGYLGREEIEVITPVIHAARQRGIDARGPLPADTLFQPRYLDDCDAVLAMYHDQGLPVLKYATFGQGINITLGLPIIRTSVDHGTALDLAADVAHAGRADAGSMMVAIDAAVAMANATFVR